LAKVVEVKILLKGNKTRLQEFQNDTIVNFLLPIHSNVSYQYQPETKILVHYTPTKKLNGERVLDEYPWIYSDTNFICFDRSKMYCGGLESKLQQKKWRKKIMKYQRENDLKNDD
jgi:hypothetical protein